jgi:hypothetical protein
MRLAILADSHLPDCSDSAQEATLRWAVAAAREAGADWLVAIGDMTAAGETVPAERVVAILEAGGVPYVSTPGNAELRDLVVGDAVCRLLTVGDNAAPVVTVDTAMGSVPGTERQRVEQALACHAAPLVLATHWPPDELGEGDREWFAELVARFRPEILVAGHKHYDDARHFAGCPLHLVRGLDPDKAKHDLPAFALLERDSTGNWHRRDVGFPAADPRLWPEEARREFVSLLGVSLMGHPVTESMQEATAAGIGVVELRDDVLLRTSRPELLAAVQAWRDGGGRCLSVHLPNMRWHDGEVTGAREFHEAVALCCDLGVDRVTVHVPRARVVDLADWEVRDQLLRVFALGLAPLVEHGIAIGIENLHRNRGEAEDDQRGFGYLPDECLEWVAELRRSLPGGTVGFHLDIGHARNNSPFSQNWTLGRWYAAVGREVVGYHLHQVTSKGNHQPFADPFAPLLSLASFFWAWRTGQLQPAPMILEIRPESGCPSWKRLRDFILGDA